MIMNRRKFKIYKQNENSEELFVKNSGEFIYNNYCDYIKNENSEELFIKNLVELIVSDKSYQNKRIITIKANSED